MCQDVNPRGRAWKNKPATTREEVQRQLRVVKYILIRRGRRIARYGWENFPLVILARREVCERDRERQKSRRAFSSSSNILERGSGYPVSFANVRLAFFIRAMRVKVNLHGTKKRPRSSGCPILSRETKNPVLDATQLDQSNE